MQSYGLHAGSDLNQSEQEVTQEKKGILNQKLNLTVLKLSFQPQCVFFTHSNSRVKNNAIFLLSYTSGPLPCEY